MSDLLYSVYKTQRQIDYNESRLILVDLIKVVAFKEQTKVGDVELAADGPVVRHNKNYLCR